MLRDLATRAARAIRGTIGTDTSIPEGAILQIGTRDSDNTARRAAKAIAEKLVGDTPAKKRLSSTDLLMKYSKARILLPLSVISEEKLRRGAARRTAPRATSVAIRMRDDEPFIYYNDGSLRALNSRKSTLRNRDKDKKARKALIALARAGA